MSVVAFTSVDGSVVMVHKHKKRKYNNEDDRDVSCMALMETENGETHRRKCKANYSEPTAVRDRRSYTIFLQT